MQKEEGRINRPRGILMAVHRKFGDSRQTNYTNPVRQVHFPLSLYSDLNETKA